MEKKKMPPRKGGNRKGLTYVRRSGPTQRRELRLTSGVDERLEAAAIASGVSVSVFTERFLDQHLPPLSQEGATPSDQGEASPPANAA